MIPGSTKFFPCTKCLVKDSINLYKILGFKLAAIIVHNKKSIEKKNRSCITEKG